MITYIKKKIQGNLFLRRVSMLAGGTAIGQLVAIASLPLLTRLYGPESFATLAVYVSILTMLAALSGLCLEYSIPLPKSQKVAAALVYLSMLSVVSSTIILSLLVVFFPNIINYFTGGKIEDFVWLLPIGVFTIGMYNTLQYWSTRNKRFGLISKTRVSQSVIGNGFKLGAGYSIGDTPFGLVAGQIMAMGSGFISLFFSFIGSDKRTLKKVKIRHLRFALNRYKDFPRYTTLEVFSNNASVQVPILLVAVYAFSPEAGYLMIAMQLLSAPMGLLSSAIAQVYLAEGADRYHLGELKEFTHRTIINLAKTAVIPLLIAALVSPTIIPYVLGDEWKRTGVLISWMVPWFFMQFICSPVSTVLYVTKNQRIAFYLQLLGLVIRVGSVLVAIAVLNESVGEVYAVSGFVFYSAYLLVVLKVLNSEGDVSGRKRI